MKNIHILPTDKFQNIKLSLFENKLYLGDIASTALPQHIYITSDEEIKEGDWCLFNESEVVKCTYSKNGEFLFSGPLTSSSNHHFSYFKKIILTTDPDLIKDGVQAIDDEFLEWFVKNPSCEKVKIDHERVLWEDGRITHYTYKIIIPKEESKLKCDFCKRYPRLEGTNKCESCYSVVRHFLEQDQKFKDKLLPDLRKKQETLEEAAENYGWRIKRNTFSNAVKANELAESAKQDFIAGAKWQAEKMYSEEESIQKIIDYVDFQFNTKGELNLEIKKWFEQFKKK